MAKIPLRAYNREIEAMIDRGESSAAIAHCRHILKYYPKHIDTYRLLGKAFLESQRYAEAADVLQRILSAVPDDFISQIGMSIIREDEGNLDAAIWHMERAFEAQPSNTAVQDELRRLYGRRDGVEPPKIRLTRGALVRMYARGELYQQTIAEIRAALAEDPLRVDLEVILARMYFLSGQTVAAIEVCSRLISKLPYCFEANRILAETLPQTSRAEDAKIYQQRVFAMDPYLAYLPPNAISSLDVPDNAVTLDRLEIETIEEEAALPEWAQTAGVNFNDEEEESLPDWFSEIKPSAEMEETTPDLSTTPETPAPFQEISSPIFESQIPEASEEETIPDWMKEAGWTPTEKVDESVQAGFNLPEEDLEIGEIPEWLQEIAPEETAVEEQETEEDLGWLEQILPSQEENLLEKEAGISLHEEVQSTEEPASPLEESLESNETDLPPYSQFTPEEEIHGEDTRIEENFETIPDWLKELGTFQQSENETEEFTGEAPHIEENPLESLEVQSSSPQPDEPSSQAAPELEDLDATMAWLESLAARQGADEATLLTPPEERQDTPPDWIQSLVEESPETSAFDHKEEEVTPTDQTTPEIIQTIFPEPDLVEKEEEITEETHHGEEGEVGKAIEDNLIEQAVSDQTPEPLPDWLMESMQEEETSFETSSEIIKPLLPVEDGEQSPSSATEELAEDDTFAWLESLAAKQGAAEETLLTKPEERQEDLPKWVREELHTEITEESVTETSSETETDLPSFEIEEKEAETVEDTQPVHLKAVSPSTPQPINEPVDESPQETPIAEIEEEVPSWLKDLEEAETESEQPPVPSDWVPEFQSPGAETPPTEKEQPQPSSPTLQSSNPAEILVIAQTALQAHELEKALQAYNQLIKDGQFLEETIHDLRDALYRYPIDITIWQALGDAYLRSNRLQEALEAYTKAEELLR
ncbi:MAG: tetratricopeptide repeat protein [Chloroflexota bacterium]